MYYKIANISFTNIIRRSRNMLFRIESNRLFVEIQTVCTSGLPIALMCSASCERAGSRRLNPNPISDLAGATRPLALETLHRYKPAAASPLAQARLRIEILVPTCLLACFATSSGIYGVFQNLVFPLSRPLLRNRVVGNCHHALRPAFASRGYRFCFSY